MILKIQRALFSTDKDPDCLIYNEDKSILAELDISEKTQRLIFRGQYKIYAECTLLIESDVIKKITIKKLIEDQSW